MAKKQPPKIPAQESEWQDFYDELAVESDRGCALVGAALLDDMLAEMFRAAFVDDASTAEDLLGMDKPLGTASARAKLAYCLGWIGPNTRDDLIRVQKIRNLFGHRREKRDFRDQQIIDWCSNFKFLADMKETRGWSGKPGTTHVAASGSLTEELQNMGAEVRDYFILAVVWLANALEDARKKLHRATYVKIVAPAMTKRQAMARLKNSEEHANLHLGPGRHKRRRQLKGEG